MAFIDSSRLADNDSFRRRVAIAMLTAMGNIASEAGDTANHTARAALVAKVLDDIDGYVDIFAGLVVTNPGISATFDPETGNWNTESSDSDIQFTVNTFINAVAGGF